MVLDASRRKQPNAPLSEPEKSLFRGLIGQMGWITRQTRPDLMVNVSMAMAAQSMGSPTIKDVINLNKAVKMLRESSDAKWCFRASHLSLQNSIVFCFADSSFANQPEVPDRVLDRLTTPEIHEGKKAPIHVIETYFGSIKRVCRSTLAAEANRFLAGVELMEVKYPNVSLWPQGQDRLPHRCQEPREHSEPFHMAAARQTCEDPRCTGKGTTR